MGLKYLILSLPRSRSAWLSAFLSNGGECGHDVATGCATVDAVLDAWSRHEGSCETGAMIAGPLLKTWLPEVQFLVVRRDASEVINSLRYFLGRRFDPYEIAARAAMLDTFAKENKVPVVDFAALEQRHVCEGIFSQLTGRYCPLGWWDKMARLNIQVEKHAWLNMLTKDRVRIAALKADVQSRLETAKCAP